MWNGCGSKLVSRILQCVQCTDKQTQTLFSYFICEQVVCCIWMREIGNVIHTTKTHLESKIQQNWKVHDLKKEKIRNWISSISNLLDATHTK